MVSSTHSGCLCCEGGEGGMVTGTSRAADMTGITKKGNQDSIGITENTLGFRRDYEK